MKTVFNEKNARRNCRIQITANWHCEGWGGRSCGEIRLVINARPSFPRGAFVGESNSMFAQFVFEKRPTPKHVFVTTDSFHDKCVNGVTSVFRHIARRVDFQRQKMFAFFSDLETVLFSLRSRTSLVASSDPFARYFGIVFPPPNDFSNSPQNCRLLPIPARQRTISTIIVFKTISGFLVPLPTAANNVQRPLGNRFTNVYILNFKIILKITHW